MSDLHKSDHDTLSGWGWMALLLGAVLMLGPFYFMFVFATLPRTEIFSVPPPLFFGDHFFANIAILMKKKLNTPSH